MPTYNVNNPVWQGNNVENISHSDSYRVGYNETINQDGYDLINLNPDIKVFIYGTEIQDIMNVSGKNSTEGTPNVCSIKIYNPRKRYVITKQDLMGYWREDKEITKKIYKIKNVSGVDILQNQSIFQTGDPIRIFMKGRFSQFYYPLFAGFVTDWNLDYPFGNAETLNLSCKDWFWLLEKSFIDVNPALYNEARTVARSVAIINEPSIDSDNKLSETSTMALNESELEGPLAGKNVKDIFEEFLLSSNKKEYNICEKYSMDISKTRTRMEQIKKDLAFLELTKLRVRTTAFSEIEKFPQLVFDRLYAIGVTSVDQVSIEIKMESLNAELDSLQKSLQSIVIEKLRALSELEASKTTGAGALNYIWSDITKNQSMELETDKVDEYLNEITRMFPITYNLVISDFFVNQKTLLTLKGIHPAISTDDVNKFGLLLDNMYQNIQDSSPTNGTETQMDVRYVAYKLKIYFQSLNVGTVSRNSGNPKLDFALQKGLEYLNGEFGIRNIGVNSDDYDNLIILANDGYLTEQQISDTQKNLIITKPQRNVSSNWKLGTKSPHQIMRESIEGIRDQCYSYDNLNNKIIGPRLFIIMPDDFYNNDKSPIASTMRQYSLTSNVFRSKLEVLMEVADTFNYRFYATPFGDLMFEPWWVDTMPHDWDLNIAERDDYLRPIFKDLPTEFKFKNPSEKYPNRLSKINLGKNILDAHIGGYSQYFLMSYGGNSFSPLIIQQKDEISSNITFRGDMIHDWLLVIGNTNNDESMALPYTEELIKMHALDKQSDFPAAEWIADGLPQYLDQLTYNEIKNKFRKYIDIESLIDEGLYVPSWDWVKLYGYKESPTITKRFLKDKVAANLYVKILFLQFLSDIYTISINMIYRPECILNRPYYIESQEMIGLMSEYTYSYNVDAEITWSANFKYIKKQVFNKMQGMIKNKLSGYDLSPTTRSDLKYFDFDTTRKDILMDLQAFEKIGSILDINVSDLSITQQDNQIKKTDLGNKKVEKTNISKMNLNIDKTSQPIKNIINNQQSWDYMVYKTLTSPPFAKLPISISSNKKYYVTIDISKLIENSNRYGNDNNFTYNQKIDFTKSNSITPKGLMTSIKQFYLDLQIFPNRIANSGPFNYPDILDLNPDLISKMTNSSFPSYKLKIPIDTTTNSINIIKAG